MDATKIWLIATTLCLPTIVTAQTAAAQDSKEQAPDEFSVEPMAVPKKQKDESLATASAKQNLEEQSAKQSGKNAATTAVPHSEEPSLIEVMTRSEKVGLCTSCISAEPGKGLKLQTPDGEFALRIRPRIQLRYVFSHDGQTGAFAQAFMIRRARLALSGHLFGENYKFKAELAFSPKDVGLINGTLTHSPLLDWYVQSAHLRDINVRAGQFRVPFNRQRLTSSGKMQLVGRTLAQNEFNLDRDVGVSILSRDLFGLGVIRYAVGVFIGEGRDAYLPGDFGMLYAGRIELLPLQPWTGSFDDDGSEVDFKRRRVPQVSIGIGAGFLDEGKKNQGINGSTPADGGTTDTYNFTLDGVAKWAGFSMLVEGFTRYGIRNPGDLVDDKDEAIETEVARQGYGGTLQAGYLIPVLLNGVEVEIAARYSLVRPLFETSLVPHDELGVGASCFLQGHTLKIQADLTQKFKNYHVATADTEVRVQLQAAF